MDVVSLNDLVVLFPVVACEVTRGLITPSIGIRQTVLWACYTRILSMKSGVYISTFEEFPFLRGPLRSVAGVSKFGKIYRRY